MRALVVMGLGSVRAAVVLGFVVPALVAGASARCDAAASLHGLVLAVEADKQQVVVRHDPFDSMPGMTMTFRAAPATVLRSLKPGDAIEAFVDQSTSPWTLSAIRVRSSAAITGPAQVVPAGVLRNVGHLIVGARVPSTAFVDQTGRPFSFDQLRGRPAVLAFIYTRCRDPRMCPLISAKFHVAEGKLGGAAHLVEVSLDPVYDTPRVLARYGSAFGADPARWTLATGKPEAVLDFAAQFGITAFPDPRIGLIHAERTVVIDRMGIIRQMLDETSWAPDEIVAATRAAEHLSSNPLQRLNLWLSAQAVAVCGNAVAGFSGILDLLVVLAIFAASGWLLYRIARRIFAAGA